MVLDTEAAPRVKPSYLLLAGILLLGFLPRMANLSWGVPELHRFMGRYMGYLYPDEPNLVQQIRGILSDPLNNAPFIYPPLHAQIGALVAWPLGLTKTSSLFLVARSISIAASILTILCVYLIGRFWNERTGLVAAAFLAVAMTSAREAHWANPESLSAFLIALAVLCLYTARTKHSTRSLFLLSVSIGFAICSKYNGIFFLHLPFLVISEACFNNPAGRRNQLYKLAASYATIAVLVLILLVPYIIYNRESFVSSSNYTSGYLSSSNGLYGAFPKPVVRPHYTMDILPVAMGLPLYVLALGGIALSVLSRQKHALFLLIAILPCWIVLETLHYRPIRFSVCLLPLLCLFAAIVIERLLSSPKQHVIVTGRLILIAVLAYSLLYSFAFVNAFTVKKDVRWSVERWIQSTNPDRAGVAMLAHNLTTNSIGIVKYTAIDRFNGESYDLSREPNAIIVPRVFLESLKQCLELQERGYSYSDFDWWPVTAPTPETLSLAQDLLQQKTYGISHVFKNQAEFAGIKFNDDILKFDYLWVTNLEILVFQRRYSLATESRKPSD